VAVILWSVKQYNIQNETNISTK